MRVLLRPFHPTTLGGGPAFLFVYIAGYVTALLQLFTFLTFRINGPLPVNWRHTGVNYGLLGLLGCAWFVWRVARQRGWVSPATGAGFALAGYATIQRVFCEFLVTLLGGPPGTWIDGLAGYYAMIRGSGLVGFTFGLAMVLASSLAERRLRHRGPDWAFPD